MILLLLEVTVRFAMFGTLMLGCVLMQNENMDTQMKNTDITAVTCANVKVSQKVFKSDNSSKCSCIPYTSTLYIYIIHLHYD